MSYFCYVCDNNIENKSKNNHLKSLTQIKFEKCIQMNHTIENPDSFYIDKIDIDDIINHQKNWFISC